MLFNLTEIERLSKAAEDIGNRFFAAFKYTALGMYQAAELAGGIASALWDMKAMSGQTFSYTVVIHKITYNEDRYGSGAGVESSGNAPPEFAYGGWTGTGGIARVHKNEFVLSQAMLTGSRPIPADVLSPRAVQSLIRSAGGGMGTVVNNQVTLDMGGVTIANGMDEAAFETKVKRAVMKGMRGV